MCAVQRCTRAWHAEGSSQVLGSVCLSYMHSVGMKRSAKLLMFVARMSLDVRACVCLCGAG